MSPLRRGGTLNRVGAASLLVFIAADARAQYGILPADPNSAERRAPIEALKGTAAALAAAFTRHVYRNAAGEQMAYRLFTPARLDPGRTYPLVVYLHGAWGSGTDNARQLQGGNVFGSLVWTLPENQERHPAFVLAPQTNVNWACMTVDPTNLPKDRPKTAAGLFCPPQVLGVGARMAFEIIDSLLATLPIDRARIYLTGQSMGGAGTWHMVAHRSGFFAAAVPVCAPSNPATATSVKDVHAWSFHGTADPLVPVEMARAMIAAVRKAGGQPRYTEYAGVGHDVFMWAYTEPALVEWLFTQTRPIGVTTARESPGAARRD